MVSLGWTEGERAEGIFLHVGIAGWGNSSCYGTVVAQEGRT